MATFWATREGEYRMAVSSPADALLIDALPHGKQIRVDAKVPRNGKHHRLVWQLFALTAKALNDGPTMQEWTAEDVCTMVKFATGHVVKMKMPKSAAARYGSEYAYLPDSISYAAMSQEDFDKFSNAAMIYIHDELCPWISASDQWPEILKIHDNSMGVDE